MPPVPPSRGICPPLRGDPPDLDPAFSLANCVASCATECAGSTGTRCGEVQGALMDPNTFANICVCSCPTALCAATTTTTASPIMNITSIALLKTPLLLKKKKIWFTLKTILLCCIILFKVFLTKALFLGLYFLIFGDLLDIDERPLERLF